MSVESKVSLGCVVEKPGNSVLYKLDGWRSLKPKWDKKKCNQCMVCWGYCPDIAIPQKSGKRLETNFDYCKGCGICSVVCPVKAIVMESEEK